MFSLMASQTLTRVKAMAAISRRVMLPSSAASRHLLPASGEKALESPRPAKRGEGGAQRRVRGSQFPIHGHHRAARCLRVVVSNAADSVAAGKHALVVQDVVDLQR